MKEQKLYICETCGSAYGTEVEAITCENFHKTIEDTITSKEYVSDYKYPLYISVKGEDEEVLYKFIGKKEI